MVEAGTLRYSSQLWGGGYTDPPYWIDNSKKSVRAQQRFFNRSVSMLNDQLSFTYSRNSVTARIMIVAVHMKLLEI